MLLVQGFSGSLIWQSGLRASERALLRRENHLQVPLMAVSTVSSPELTLKLVPGSISSVMDWGKFLISRLVFVYEMARVIAATAWMVTFIYEYGTEQVPSHMACAVSKLTVTIVF